jgi:hypothetical protein
VTAGWGNSEGGRAFFYRTAPFLYSKGAVQLAFLNWWSELMNSERHALEIARRMLANGIYIQRMFGGRGLVGLALMEAHLAGDPWLTVQQITEKAKVSDDTVRRRLADLVTAGRVRSKIEDGRKLYAVTPATARQVVNRLVQREKGAAKPQSADADCG